MAIDTSLDLLFTPFRLRDLAFPNRFAMAPMTRGFSPGGVPTPDVAAYYARRAAGGVALIVTEGTYVDDPAAGGSTDVPRFHGEDALAGWAGVLRAVRAAGGRIFPQLWHLGAQRKPGTGQHPEVRSISPSGVTPEGLEPARVMDRADIERVVASYARGAADVFRLGFDGVELHGAHGYLIDQFLRAATNRRRDAYGGSPPNRARFAADIVRACRAATSPSFPIVLRVSNWTIVDYGARLAESPAELELLLAPLVDAGLDMVHASVRRHWEPAFAGSPMGLAGWVKRITGLPTMTVGSVGLDTAFGEQGRPARPVGLDRLGAQFAAGEFDMVALGRVLLSDPAWVRKVQQGRFSELLPFAEADRRRLT